MTMMLWLIMIAKALGAETQYLGLSRTSIGPCSVMKAKAQWWLLRQHGNYSIEEQLRMSLTTDATPGVPPDMLALEKGRVLRQLAALGLGGTTVSLTMIYCPCEVW